MSVVRTIQKKINELTSGLFATWMPDDRATIGDYGQLRDGRLNRHANLNDRGIPIEEYVHSGSDPSFKYSDGVLFRGSAAAAADGAVAGSAEVDINFTKEGAFVYHSQGAEYRKINNRDEVFAALIKKVATGDIVWQDEFVLVDEAFHCDHSTILISEANSGGVSVSADGGLDTAENFANANGNLSFAVQHGSILDYAGRTDSNPLYHAIRLKFPDPPDGGDGGGGAGAFAQSIPERVKSLLGLAFPKPEEIDVSPYEKNGNVFAIKALATGALLDVAIVTLTVENLFENDPTASVADDWTIETIEVENPAANKAQNTRTAGG